MTQLKFTLEQSNKKRKKKGNNKKKVLKKYEIIIKGCSFLWGNASINQECVMRDGEVAVTISSGQYKET